MSRRIVSALALAVAAACALGATGDPSQAGAYCPLPEPGQRPACLAPAQATYAGFFAALEDGELEETDAGRIASDLGSGERAHLALSSLAYGYYRLAQKVASDPSANPQLVERLEQWNGLLAAAYEGSEPQAPLRSSLREAAADLHAKAPNVAVGCAAVDTPPGALCTATGALVSTLAAVDSAAGIRSPLSRLMQRLLGDDAP